MAQVQAVQWLLLSHGCPQTKLVGTGSAQTTPGFSSGTVAAPTDSSVAGAFTKASLDDVIQKCSMTQEKPLNGLYLRHLLSYLGFELMQTQGHALTGVQT